MTARKKGRGRKAPTLSDRLADAERRLKNIRGWLREYEEGAIQYDELIEWINSETP